MITDYHFFYVGEILSTSKFIILIILFFNIYSISFIPSNQSNLLNSPLSDKPITEDTVNLPESSLNYGFKQNVGQFNAKDILYYYSSPDFFIGFMNNKIFYKIYTYSNIK